MSEMSPMLRLTRVVEEFLPPGRIGASDLAHFLDRPTGGHYAVREDLTGKYQQRVMRPKAAVEFYRAARRSLSIQAGAPSLPSPSRSHCFLQPLLDPLP